MHSRNGAGNDARSGSELLAESMVEMLQVRTSDALPTWLAQRYAQLYPDARLRLLRVFPGPAARTRSVPRYAVFSMDDPVLPQAPRLVSVDSMVVDAIREAKPWSMVMSDGSTRLLVTLAAGGEARYVVELSGAFDFGDSRRLGALATIASRYFERLIDAETDPLTRLANRRAFNSQLEGMRRWTTTGRPWFFAVLDIDHFKRINDNWGHLYGDEILVCFAQLLRETFRAGDLIYRFGGEEFVLVYATDQESGGRQTLERFRSAVEKYAFPGVGRVTVSAGFTRISDASMPAATLIDRADQAVYFAKAHGRNQVCGWEKLVEEGRIRPSQTRADVTIF